MEEETKKSMVFVILVIGMMWLTSLFASVDAKLFTTSERYLETFFGLECGEIFLTQLSSAQP